MCLKSRFLTYKIRKFALEISNTISFLNPSYVTDIAPPPPPHALNFKNLYPTLT